MDNNLSVEAKALLRELRGSPYFHEILDSLDDSELPYFKPIREGSLSVDGQQANWLFMSGKLRERSRILTFLSGDRND